MTEQLSVSQSLAQKLHPRRYPGMSGKMAAIVAYILGEHWTQPGIAELVISGDGFVLAREEGDVGCNNWVQSDRLEALMDKPRDDIEGGLILEDGLHPDDPEERAWVEAMRQAAEKARRLYGDEEEEE